MECVRPAWGVDSWIRPFGREAVSALTRDSFPDFGRPRISIFFRDGVVSIVLRKSFYTLDFVKFQRSNDRQGHLAIIQVSQRYLISYIFLVILIHTPSTRI